MTMGIDHDVFGVQVSVENPSGVETGYTYNLEIFGNVLSIGLAGEKKWD
jgi:hypothetical protein